MDAKQRELAQVCIDLEKQIWETFSEGKPRCPINNEDWTDAHQEYLEYQWFIDELNTAYIKAQKELFAYLDSIGETHRKVRTAKEYYEKQKDFEDTVAYYMKHHINGF